MRHYLRSMPLWPSSKSYPECREMLEGLCRKILSDKQMWAKSKLFAAAALSMIDMFTDTLMVFEFMREEKTGFAHIMMGSIFANLGMQLAMVIVQNFKLGWRKVLMEVLIVSTCIKPGVDAFRVASGKEIVEGHVLEPNMEMTFTKGAELLAEAIPGTIVQMAAVVRTGSETLPNAAFSFAYCVLTSTFTSSNMSYDWDTGKKSRAFAFFFYRNVPDKAKGKFLVFLSLYFLSAFNLLTPALTFVQLQLKGGMTLVAKVLCGELALFFVVKALM